MRSTQIIAAAAGALLALTPALALAQDDGAETTSTESTDTSGSGETSAMKQPGALLDASEKQRSSMLSFFAVADYHYGFGLGAAVRYTLPIVPNGFIPKLNDSVELEFGADLWYGWYGFTGGYLGIGVPVEGRWTFHITDKFSAYAKVGVGLAFAIGGTQGNTFFSYVPPIFPYFPVGPGLLYKFTDSMYLRAEITGSGTRVGLGMDF